MSCPNGKRGCHRMRTFSEVVLRRFENGDVEIEKRQSCRTCCQSKRFVVVQQTVKEESRG